jgi:predicted methyltransferase
MHDVLLRRGRMTFTFLRLGAAPAARISKPFMGAVASASRARLISERLEEHKKMKSRKNTLALALLALGGLLGSIAHAQEDQAARMRVALAAPERPAEDKARDEARKPIEVVQFLGIQDGMTVVDVIAAGGWFTEVLSAAVGPSGKVYAQNPTFFTQREGFAERESARHDRLGNVEAVHGDLPAHIAGVADAAITALNLHDIYNSQGEQAAVEFARQVFQTLKPGGVFGVIDHAGSAGHDNTAFHRMQVEQARAVLTQAGFTIEAESDMLANPADDHTKGVRDASVAGRTDQFLIRARKQR